MEHTTKSVICTYLVLTFLNTLATSFIWGINTLFLLNAGLSNLQAFAANAFFTVGQVLFEIPTGIFADIHGRRLSFLLGAITLVISTLLYVWMWHISGAFWGWALASIFLGLGYTFYSGATEAWLVDALAATQFTGTLESVFAKGQIVTGIGMLMGSIAGGVIADYTNLGVPYLVRAVVLVVTFMAAYLLMFDLGFEAKRDSSPLIEVKKILSATFQYGIKKSSVRWVVLSEIFISGVSIYAFYAAQPFLLKLYGNFSAYSIAGLVAAIVAGAQIIGGLFVPYIQKVFHRRTSFLFIGAVIQVGLLCSLGFVQHFWMAILLLVIWGLTFAATMPVRQTYLNGLIPSQQRATILSFDSLMGSAGGAAFQPLLGGVADIWNYGTSYFFGGLITAISLPFIGLSRYENESADLIAENKSKI